MTIPLFKKLFNNILSETELSSISTGIDTIGDIIILKIPESLESKKKIICDKILDQIRSVKTVFVQQSSVIGDYRLRKLEFISGENKTLTIHKEHGCKFYVDVCNTFFSPRLSTERLRISNLVNKNEIIINMFGGVGPFCIILGKKSLVDKIFSIDINPYAHELLIKNIQINKVDHIVNPILGNSKNIVPSSLLGLADRIIMPLPENSFEYIDAALSGIKNSGGIIHLYSHIYLDELNSKIKLIIERIENQSRRCKILSNNIVKNIGPGWGQVVFDIQIK